MSASSNVPPKEGALKSAELPKKDVPPCLETMETVSWEQMLSYLPSTGIVMMSHRISKTLGAGMDKKDSPENAAKLALADLMNTALKAHSKSVSGEELLLNDDAYANDWGTDGREPPKFDGESYLHTYHLALELLKDRLPGDDLKEGVEPSHYLNLLLMWFIYGLPAIPTPTTAQYDIVSYGMGQKLLEILRLPRPPVEMTEEEEEMYYYAPEAMAKDRLEEIRGKEMEQRMKNIGFYSHGRLLRMVIRLAIIANNWRTIDFLNVLRPSIAVQRNDSGIVLDADQLLGRNVGLQGLDDSDWNGTYGFIETAVSEEDGGDGLIGFRRDPFDREPPRRFVKVDLHNLRPTQSDSVLSIDQRIVAAMLTCEELMYGGENSAMENDRFERAARNILILRGTVEGLKKICQCEADSSQAGIVPSLEFVPDDRPELFRCNYLRLFNANIALSQMLVFRAKKIGSGPDDYHANLIDDLLSFGRDRTARHEVMQITDASFRIEGLLREAAECLSSASRYLAKIRASELDENARQFGTFGQALSPRETLESHVQFSLALSRTVLHKALADTSVAERTPFMPSSELHVNRSYEECAAEHAKNGVSNLRFLLEQEISKVILLSRGSCTVQELCNSFHLHFKIRQLICSAFELFKIYDSYSDFREPEERSDGIWFLKFAAVLALKALARENRLRICVLYSLSKYIAITRRFGNIPVEEIQQLEAQVNSWLANGFECIYYDPRNG